MREPSWSSVLATLKIFNAWELPAPMGKDDLPSRDILELPENPRRFDVIKAYATVEYNINKRIKQESHTLEEIEEMEATLEQARRQCIAMLAELEKTSEEDVEPVPADGGEPIPMNAVELSDTKPGSTDTVAMSIREDAENSVDGIQHHECPRIEAAQDSDEREGVCGLRWLCF